MGTRMTATAFVLDDPHWRVSPSTMMWEYIANNVRQGMCNVRPLLARTDSAITTGTGYRAWVVHMPEYIYLGDYLSLEHAKQSIVDHVRLLAFAGQAYE